MGDEFIEDAHIRCPKCGNKTYYIVERAPGATGGES